MKLFLLSLCCGLELMLCNSEVCLNTWTPVANPRSPRGHYSAGTGSTRQQCMVACEWAFDCIAIEYDQRLSVRYCWLQNDPTYLPVNATNATNIGLTQYLMNRSCTDDPTEACPIDWTWNLDTKASNGIQVYYWTEYDCFTYCRYTDGCAMVDFDNTTAPPCSVHTNPSDSIITGNSAKGVIQYRINKTCSTPQPSDMTIGRCPGQWFPSTDWCSPGTTIHIVGAFLKQNPLCCNRNAEDAYPPDASSLMSISLSELDRDFYQEILSCEGNSSCDIQARTPDNTDCPDQGSGQGFGTNFVTIVYQCSNGDTVSQATTMQGTARLSRTTPIRPRTSSVAAPDGDMSPASPTDAATPTNVMSFPTPTRIMSVPTPTNFMSTATSSANVMSFPSPTRITNVPTPTRIMSVPTPTNAMSTVTPTNVMSTVTPTNVMSTVTPTSVMSTVTPTSVMSTVTPTSVMSTVTLANVVTNRRQTPARFSASNAPATTIPQNSGTMNVAGSSGTPIAVASPGPLTTTTTTTNAVASASMNQGNDNSRRLIIGLVVGLGVPLLLICIVAIILVWLRYRRRQKQKITTVEHQIPNPYYNMSTRTGMYPENQMNEVTMAVDTM